MIDGRWKRIMSELPENVISLLREEDCASRGRGKGLDANDIAIFIQDNAHSPEGKMHFQKFCVELLSVAASDDPLELLPQYFPCAFHCALDTCRIDPSIMLVNGM